MKLQPPVRQRLLEHLEGPLFGLKLQADKNVDFDVSESDRLTLNNARVYVSPPIRIGGELDSAPDLLIIDRGLATIGLVHVLEPADPRALPDQAKSCLDRATYVRDLLLAGGAASGCLPFFLDYTVECVLVLSKELLSEMAAVVRDIIANTRFLHATGLNLLTYSQTAEFDLRELQRAFAWLLPATRRKLLALKTPTNGRLTDLQLFNYRLPGLRDWKLTADRVHLLHGPNGTGKSSIAEALELAVTGSVERIQTSLPADYAATIRNSQSAGAASVCLALSNGESQTFAVVKEGASVPALKPDLPVTAFRLDQTVMDQLIRANSQQRAKVLTKAFFPGPAYADLETAHEEFLKVFGELPAEIQKEIQDAKPQSDDWPNAVVPRLEWVENTNIPVERVPDFLPLSRANLNALSGIVREIANCLNQLDKPMDREHFEATLKDLDDALGGVRANVRRYRDAVVGSLDALKRVAGWTPSPTPAKLAYPQLLEAWTERVALRDVLRKHLDISRTAAAAKRAGWSPAAAASPGLLSDSADALDGSIPELVKAAERCDTEHDDFLNQLQGPEGGARPEDEIGSLATSEIAGLNLIGDWWAKHQPSPPATRLGNTIQEAISKNQAIEFGSIHIGSASWTDGWTSFLTPLAPALEELLAFDQISPLPPNAPPRPIYRSPVVRLSGFKAALAAARKESEAALKVEQTLMKRLAEEHLNEALDEVVALFTPARWAYEGLFVNARRRDGKVAVELVTSRTGSQAETRLNTAELNVVVLALYLLCGPTMSNPLSTIILDDPLQNMDELTAATVARGTAKIAALLPDGWQLIMMFHGEEDLETFRREVRGSVYYLPWLGPANVPAEKGTGVVLDVRRKPSVDKPPKLSALIEMN